MPTRTNRAVIVTLALVALFALSCAKATVQISSGEDMSATGQDTAPGTADTADTASANDIGASGDTELDDSVVSDSSQDGELSDMPGPGTFGEICTDDSDCASLLCVPAEPERPGTASVCSTSCDTTCPEGWACTLTYRGTRALIVCLPQSDEALCGIAPECQPTDEQGNPTTDSGSCQTCGKRERTCGPNCRYGEWSECTFEVTETSCKPGSTDTGSCGKCGSRSRTCQNDCSWGAWGDCGGEKTCSPGTTDTQPCGNKCGTQKRTCLDTCEWGEFGVCENEGVCRPGDFEKKDCSGDPCVQERRYCRDDCTFGNWDICKVVSECSTGQNDTRTCGLCDKGSQTRQCIAACGWGDYGVCTYVGPQPCTQVGELNCLCAPGSKETRSCGKCGTQERICSGTCGWGDWSACTGEGECTAKSTEERNTPLCGKEQRTCDDSCKWGGWVETVTPTGECNVNQTDSAVCGLCDQGKKERTCDATCKWGSYGSCAYTGTKECSQPYEDNCLCAPNAKETRACGKCGTQERTCNGTCGWGDWSVCTGEKECLANTFEERNKALCGKEKRTCSAECVWGNWVESVPSNGSCEPTTPDSRSCGLCSKGSETRVCDSSCNWGNYGSCTYSGTQPCSAVGELNCLCSPGTKETRPCGNCGTQERVCDGTCGWGLWSVCSGEGECKAGTSETRDLAKCGKETRTCSDSCVWGGYQTTTPSGDCEPNSEQTQSCGKCGTQKQVCTSSCSWPTTWEACTGEGVCDIGQQDTTSCLCETLVCDGTCNWPTCSDSTKKDQYEPNDTKGTAYIINGPQEYPIGSGVYYFRSDDASTHTLDASILPAYNDDWYRLRFFDVKQGGAKTYVILKLANIPAGENYEMEIQWACLASGGGSGSCNTESSTAQGCTAVNATTKQIVLDADNKCGGAGYSDVEVYVRIYAKGGTRGGNCTNLYQLQWTQ